MVTLSPSSLPPAYLGSRGDRAYPMHDGRPLGETDYHRQVIIDLIGALKIHFAGQPVYVSGNLLLFYEPGNKRRHVSPDVLVTRGLPPGPRLNDLVWQEGKPPDLVIEVTSKTTRHAVLRRKFLVYQDKVRVPEYFLFDPLGDYLEPRLQGFRLHGGKYVRIRPLHGRLASKQLSLALEAQGNALRLIDQKTGQPLLAPRELAERAADELASERAARTRDKQEIARLRDEIVRLRKQHSTTVLSTPNF